MPNQLLIIDIALEKLSSNLLTHPLTRNQIANLVTIGIQYSDLDQRLSCCIEWVEAVETIHYNIRVNLFLTTSTAIYFLLQSNGPNLLKLFTKKAKELLVQDKTWAFYGCNSIESAVNFIANPVVLNTPPFFSTPIGRNLALH
jgi:hypothetical protein